MVKQAGGYPWSSHRHTAWGRPLVGSRPVSPLAANGADDPFESIGFESIDFDPFSYFPADPGVPTIWS